MLACAAVFALYVRHNHLNQTRNIETDMMMMKVLECIGLALQTQLQWVVLPYTQTLLGAKISLEVSHIEYLCKHGTDKSTQPLESERIGDTI